jgi:glycosyltransferase involved in cell wall biosynthesis
MEPLSATLITCNEERNIAGALDRLRFASEIVVVDSGSTDATVEICRRYTDRVFHRDWTGFVDQKNFATARASHDWVLSLDADERPSAALESEIAALRARGFDRPGYRIPRITFFMGRWIRHGDWYPDYQLRLFDRRRGAWQGGRVHESVRVEGEPGRLSGPIEHFTYHSLSDYLKRLDLYSGLAAADYRARGRRASVLRLAGNPPIAFLKNYVLKLGILDGVPGLMVAAMAAVSVYFKYAKLYELERRERLAAELDSGAPSSR